MNEVNKKTNRQCSYMCVWYMSNFVLFLFFVFCCLNPYITFLRYFVSTLIYYHARFFLPQIWFLSFLFCGWITFIKKHTHSMQLNKITQTWTPFFFSLSLSLSSSIDIPDQKYIELQDLYIFDYWRNFCCCCCCPNQLYLFFVNCIYGSRHGEKIHSVFFCLFVRWFVIIQLTQFLFFF